jgi:hypothetical protein
MKRPVMYGREAMVAMGLCQIAANTWVGPCPRCRVIAVFTTPDGVAEGGSTFLKCPDLCPLRAEGGEA